MKKTQSRKGAEERAKRIVERWEADEYDVYKDFLQDSSALLASLRPDGEGFRALHGIVKGLAASLKLPDEIFEATHNEVSRLENMKGVALEDLGRLEDAVEAYMKAYRLGSFKALRNLVPLLEHGAIESARAVALLEKLVTIPVKDASARFSLHLALVMLNAARSAREAAMPHLIWLLAYFRDARERLDAIAARLAAAGEGTAFELLQWFDSQRREKPLSFEQTAALVRPWVAEMRSAERDVGVIFDAVVSRALAEEGGRLDYPTLSRAAREALG